MNEGSFFEVNAAQAPGWAFSWTAEAYAGVWEEEQTASTTLTATSPEIPVKSVFAVDLYSVVSAAARKRR